jgi:hypothetical protein
VTRTRLPAVVSTTVATGTLAGCGGATPGQTAAQAACQAYAGLMRHQAATTVEQADAIRATARSDARRAADADPAWRALQRDIDDFPGRQSALSQHSAVDEVDAYFAADRRVQADGRSARGGHRSPPRP